MIFLAEWRALRSSHEECRILLMYMMRRCQVHHTSDELSDSSLEGLSDSSREQLSDSPHTSRETVSYAHEGALDYSHGEISD